jgi:fumarate hydratase class II
MGTDYRIECDSMGEIEVPAEALYGAQTQRALDNFPVSGLRMPPPFIHALALIKRAAAAANHELDLLDAGTAAAIVDAAGEVADGRHDAQFPVDVFQTGSGTSTNMNANEVIARLASVRAGTSVHPNNHVNMGQSSNDVIPSAIHVSACIAIQGRLLPALDHLAESISVRARELAGAVKTGRTHLMDAMPVRLDQELGAWASQVRDGRARIEASLVRLQRLALGGTAVGSGVNAHPEFGRHAAAHLAALTQLPFVSSDDHFRDLASQDAAVEISGQLNTLAVSLMKIANDLRWMNSGPLAGLAEIRLPALQPGSSIMPGKVNPVIPEAVAMVCAKVMGNHTTMTIAGQSGSFQLNVMLPLIAHDLLQSIAILGNVARLLADRVINGFTVNRERLADALDRNPILVTALNAVIGYEKGAEIAKKAYAEGRPVLEVAREMSGLSDAELQRLLDPIKLTKGGIPR